MKKRSQERLCILFPPNGTQQAGEGGGREEGDSHCSSSGEQLEAGGSGEQRVDSCWWLLANELVPFPLPLRELREHAEGRSLFIRQIVLKHLVWAKHYAKHRGAWG